MANPENIPEEFLHFIWENKLFYHDDIFTINHEIIKVVDLGQRNTNSGPDFFNAKIKIGDTLWVGNVEIHKKSSYWNLHNHQENKAYNNVILHVVEEYDKPVFSESGKEVPTLILNYPERIRTNYKRLLFSKTRIPCQEQFHKIDLFAVKLSYHRLMIERLEYKTTEILQRLSENNNSWNETFYQFLARMFGFKVNAQPFEMLAKSLPLNIISKHKSNLFQIEALLFGNAGLLNEQLLGDDYYIKLREEYSFLYKKYNLKGIESHLWKFMRLRPVNFPTIRIAQFAALVYKSEALFSKLIGIKNQEDIHDLFNITASEYWNSHYRFNKASKKNSVKELGQFSINSLIINVVIPFLFVYGETQMKNQLKDRALDFLEKIPPEKNSIIDIWKQLGIKVRSAFETQALLQLKNFHCDQKKCLNCQIGNKLVNL